MPKYKNVNEGVIDRFISAIFTRVGKGFESRAINKLRKTDPELAKQLKKLQDTKKEIEKNLSKKSKKQLAKGEPTDALKRSIAAFGVSADSDW
tara:strand:+ start:411 stop:689 length:279 start_codon:yes stop_codon:yes gene_type:complete